MSGSSYRFRLERVRALRERREDQAKQEFGTAFQMRRNAADEVECAQDRIAAARSAQLYASGDELRAHQSYLERMETDHRLAAALLAQREDELEQRRRALTKASQDREALERLKQKGLADFNREAARVEQVMLDEIAGNGYWRKAA